jgi:hypothetical protein
LEKFDGTTTKSIRQFFFGGDLACPCHHHPHRKAFVVRVTGDQRQSTQMDDDSVGMVTRTEFKLTVNKSTERASRGTLTLVFSATATKIFAQATHKL